MKRPPFTKSDLETILMAVESFYEMEGMYTGQGDSHRAYLEDKADVDVAVLKLRNLHKHLNQRPKPQYVGPNTREKMLLVADWLGWQDEQMSFGLRSMRDAEELYDEAMAGDNEMAEDWTSAARKRVLGYDPMSV